MFDELFADDFVDHTPQPDSGADKEGVRGLYKMLRAAFPDFGAEIHWQRADGDTVTTFRTYYGTHKGPLLGTAATGREIHAESVDDAMHVQNGKITGPLERREPLSAIIQLGCALLALRT